jgi:hypothetical protein
MTKKVVTNAEGITWVKFLKKHKIVFFGLFCNRFVCFTSLGCFDTDPKHRNIPKQIEFRVASVRTENVVSWTLSSLFKVTNSCRIGMVKKITLCQTARAHCRYMKRYPVVISNIYLNFKLIISILWWRQRPRPWHSRQPWRRPHHCSLPGSRSCTTCPSHCRIQQVPTHKIRFKCI